ncbi:hypothetical protein M5K25_019476 [Dendrobium thyrsiflorum]|uniref:Uncharacterized protein n=1 Tax=Dendrobium thyrsiflorum TaxID=117978 RepID=A0ABD0UF07_DENTH
MNEKPIMKGRRSPDKTGWMPLRTMVTASKGQRSDTARATVSPSVNIAPFLLQKGTLDPKLEGIKREIEDPLLLLDHRQSYAEPPPDHHLKALHSAGPPPKGPTLRRTTT